MTQLQSAIQLSEGERIVHFSHANGYAPQTYTKFLDPFKNGNSVIASVHRPLWESNPHPNSVSSWREFGEDISELVESLDQPVLSIGHSMGAAASVMAAAKQPSGFKALVLVEPALVPANYYRILRWFGPLIKARYPLITRTLNRVDRWDSPQSTFAHFRPKSVFQGFSDEVLWDYVAHGTYTDSEGGTRLNYSKEWEARCYMLADNIWHDLRVLSIPVLVIRGARSNTFSLKTCKALRSACPNFEFLEIPGAGHLLPFEKPDILAGVIGSWMDKL
ncbi:MAG: pimeloyl-ACP methyl ester carboxylesterase [Pseudohongiellaceae bacterium]